MTDHRAVRYGCMRAGRPKNEDRADADGYDDEKKTMTFPSLIAPVPSPFQRRP